MINKADRSKLIEECAEVADYWSKPDNFLLAAGEMKPETQRCVSAIAQLIGRMIRIKNERY